MAQAVTVLQDGTLGRICKSAPTVCGNFMDEWIVCAGLLRPLRQIEPPIEPVGQSA